MKRVNVILLVGEGYPRRFSANNTKAEFIALGLKEAGCSVSIMDSEMGTKGYNTIEEGVSDTGIPYVIMPRKGKITVPLKNLPVLYKKLKEFHKPGEINHIIMGIGKVPFNFIDVALYKSIGYSVSTLFHEWHITIAHGLFEKINAHLTDKYLGYALDAIFPISRYLWDKSTRFKKPLYMLPILADYSHDYSNIPVGNHFTYCCAAEYLIRNTMLLDAFQSLLLESNIDVSLVLVLNGNDFWLDSAKKLVNTYKFGDSVKILTKLPQNELFTLYASSIALLIPLDPHNLQDKARFSQKIAEYISTQRPIITSNAGEIPYYFKDNESAVIVPFSVAGYKDGMFSIIKNSPLADRIGNEGYKVGIDSFDFRCVGVEIKQFIEEL